MSDYRKPISFVAKGDKIFTITVNYDKGENPVVMLKQFFQAMENGEDWEEMKRHYGVEIDFE